MRLLIITIFSLIVVPAWTQTLEEYRQIAAEQNPRLQAKYKAFEAALERIPQVNSLPDPTFSMGVFVSPVETRVGPQRARLSLTQMFPWFGTLKASGDVAALDAEAQFQVFLDAKNKLYFEVAAAYYPLYELERITALELENIEILESYKAIATSKFENGKGTLVNVLRADLKLKDALTSLKILQERRKPLLAAFNQLLNRDESEDVNMPDDLSLTQSLISKDSLLSDNPVLNELEIRIEASEKRQALADKHGLPKLGVGLDYVIVGERRDMQISDNGKNALMPMVTVGIPLFRGKYKAAKKEAQLMQESYSLQKEDRVNQLQSAYEMTVFEIEQQRNLLKLYDEQVAEAEQILNLLTTAYSNDEAPFEEVLAIQQQLLKYKKMKARAWADYHKSVAKLNYLTAKKY